MSKTTSFPKGYISYASTKHTIKISYLIKCAIVKLSLGNGIRKHIINIGIKDTFIKFIYRIIAAQCSTMICRIFDYQIIKCVLGIA